MLIDAFLLVACATSAGAGYVLRSALGRRGEDARNAYARGKTEGERAASAAKKAEVEAAYLRGREAGAKEITVELTPYTELDEGWLSTTALVGYRKQLLVRGLPVGDASIVVVEKRSRVDKAEIAKMLALLQPAMEEAAKVLAKQGVKALLK